MIFILFGHLYIISRDLSSIEMSRLLLYLLLQLSYLSLHIYFYWRLVSLCIFVVNMAIFLGTTCIFRTRLLQTVLFRIDTNSNHSIHIAYTFPDKHSPMNRLGNVYISMNWSGTRESVNMYSDNCHLENLQSRGAIFSI